MPTFRNPTELKKHIENMCTLAVQETANEIMEQLKKSVSEQYYKDPGFHPNVYHRTETFLSACTYKMLTSTAAEIGVDTDSMRYSNGFDSVQVVEWASQSMHGAEYYQTDTEDFWTVFMEWADKNAIPLLRKNLQKHGIKTKK